MDPSELLERLRDGNQPTLQDVKELCEKGSEVIGNEPNVLKVDPPVSVCGDIHGQFYDLLQLFKTAGDCPETCYLFLGDYVDRGMFSLETFITLLSLKVLYPDRIFLLRGNHESRQVTQVYGFYDECLKRFGQPDVWRICTALFDLLPLAAVIGEKIFCIHGGLSPAINSVDEVRKLERKLEIPHEGGLSDMLWSDPAENNEDPWTKNPRGTGFIFGQDALETFLHHNDMQLLARSHQLVMEGYKWSFDDSLITVWSAPNYCYRCGNTASVMEVKDNEQKPTFKIFDSMPEELRKKPPATALPEYFL
eukprot:gnl/MRDRNA2_/MRDRNA2_120562_c0_seq1.p1 gnl/MRDRNA2_/MRDRNA2_120562_c0~~gnl/MRDRNA2_/MRDRNA2_120562_c0_seq1.p1  ORF type:complete len:307 (-),score=56.43 gnl/MRDRNA2_/MRDRNA2_120562_c0_seq1:14-934(-)